jgi:pimeloyl-ACP methyl ester carboxylesterase
MCEKAAGRARSGGLSFVEDALRNFIQILAILSLASVACAQPKPPTGAMLTAQLGPGFESKVVQANGTQLHYVRSGDGPPVVLLHGFPEDWYEFRLILPRLAKTFTVVAVDLRGVGESAPSEKGYEAENLAEDIHQLISALGLQRPYIFGHDIGGMVAYALARRYPEGLRGVMILDVAFPGLDPWQDLVGGPHFWHVRFHQTALAEKLVTGRQADYFRYFLAHLSNAEVDHYANAYRDPNHLRAAFETYRAFPANEKFFAAQRSHVDLPFVIGSGEHDAFAEFVPRIAAAMRANGCTNVKTEMIKGAAHYVAEEKPDELASLIEHYAR